MLKLRPNITEKTLQPTAALFCLISAFAVSACLSPSAPKAVGPVAGESGTPSSGATSPGGSTGSSTLIDSYLSSGTVKVIFNKSNFYNNHNPNSFGCAGDAKNFFNPFTDRIVPAKPSWVKNVAVEITNSNATNGPSEASGCGLTGIGAPEAKNCAGFDDLQPLQGDSARAILVGGYGCLTNSAACLKNNTLNDIWNLSVPATTTGALWVKQSGALPTLSSTVNATSGLIWHGGDYDEIHDQFYIYGGATPDTSDPTGVMFFSDEILQLTFDSDRSLSTTVPPAIVAASTRGNYAGWSSVGSNVVAQLNVKNLNVPPPLVGSTFTYGLRRDPSLKSYCKEGSAGCTTSKFTTTGLSTAVSLNEHEDYFFLAGGLPTDTAAQNDYQPGLFFRHMYLYKPHGFSNDVGTSGSTAPSGGDWMLVSNLKDTGAGLLADVSTTVMSVVQIGYDSSSDDEPYIPVFVNETAPDASTTFEGWLGRGYHRTVYDPAMNRFYIFGGLQNSGATDTFTSGTSTLTGGTAADIASSDVWVYDPPALGRRPTAACFTATSPDAKALPIGSTGSTDGKILGANMNLGPNRNYAAGRFVFPPGGCLQRIDSPETRPDERFEHSMAFDRDHRAMMIFGGCTESNTIVDSGSVGAGNPLGNCTSLSMLNDSWFWLPPTRTEFVSKDYRSSTTGPYNASTLLSNIFTIEFWIDFMNLFVDGNSPSNDSITAPRVDEILGKWVSLTPTGTLPSKRASASFFYDRAHHKFYLQGGFGCVDTACATPQVLNDLWEFTPPDVATECDREEGTCTNQGFWTQIRDNKDDDGGQPTQRLGGIAAFAESQISFGDDFYTVSDSACIDQGPIATTDSSVNKQFVGAIYLDIDRGQLSSTSNILINLRFLPFDANTKAPGYTDNNTPLTSVDDSDSSSSTDQALIRVQLLSNPLTRVDQIQSLIQPRYHEFISGAPVLADTFMYVAGGSGQITEKQIFIPMTIDSNINLIKIERVSGSVKFYEMTVSKF